MYRNIAVVSMVVVVLFGASLSKAALATDPIAVGSGANTAHVVINFSDGANYQFDVSFDGETSGIGLMDIIEAGTALETERTYYGDAAFIDGITYAGDSDIGFGGGEDWWHYWVRESDAEAWQSPDYGASSRTVADGSWDGWVYGNAGEPVPEPATLALMAAWTAGLAAMGRRKRTVHDRN